MRLLQVNPISRLKVGFNEFTSCFAEDMMNQQIFFSLHSAKNQMEEHFTDVQSMYYFKALSSSSLSISCAIKMRDHCFLFKRKATEKKSEVVH